MKIGIYGATGYSGMQLVSLLKRHPHAEIIFLSSNRFAGKKFSQIYTKFSGMIDDVLLDEESTYPLLTKVDLVFLALPHGVSMRYVKKIKNIDKDIKIIDLSGDFRLQDSDIYEHWYGFDHLIKNSIKDFAYGLPEINRDAIKNAQYVANPGCFPTSMILPLYPLVKEDVIEGKILVDSKTGVSGAGRKESQNFLFSEVQDSTYAYKTGAHRHSPEVIETIKDFTGKHINFLFSPHIVPAARGIYSTIYVNLKNGITLEDIQKTYTDYYKDEYFIELVDYIPSTKDVNRSNKNFIHFEYDNLTETLIIYSTIDNLMKGASSQAIQNMNIMYGLEETTGIDFDLFYI